MPGEVTSCDEAALRFEELLDLGDSKGALSVAQTLRVLCGNEDEFEMHITRLLAVAVRPRSFPRAQTVSWLVNELRALYFYRQSDVVLTAA